jgi:hypothetical protein
MAARRRLGWWLAARPGLGRWMAARRGLGRWMGARMGLGWRRGRGRSRRRCQQLGLLGVSVPRLEQIPLGEHLLWVRGVVVTFVRRAHRVARGGVGRPAPDV